jgi:UDP-glucuronate 4-epimerase
MRVLVTGAAGFIGNALSLKLLARGDHVIGLDSMNDYYDVSLKEARLARTTPDPKFDFRHMDISDRAAMENLFKHEKIDAVVNLAAQAGVRYSIENPAAYIDANLVGFGNILEGCRHSNVGHLVYASSSSVYGANVKLPFSEADSVDHPISLYAATKKANELMAHCYSHLYGMSTTGLRFFTVYGPWGRPDMALFKFAKAILAGEPIDVYNNGNMVRDFTFVEDIVEGVIRVVDSPPVANTDWDSESADCGTSSAPYAVYNIGNQNPVELMRYIEVLQAELGVEAKLNMMGMQPGDVPATYADVSRLESDLGYRPVTTIEEGISRFVSWYREYY